MFQFQKYSKRLLFQHLNFTVPLYVRRSSIEKHIYLYNSPTVLLRLKILVYCFLYRTLLYMPTFNQTRHYGYKFLLYISISPLSIKSSSTIIFLLQRGATAPASPPVAITVHFSPSSFSSLSTIPSIVAAFP